MSPEHVPFDCGAAAAVVVTRGPLVESQHFLCHVLCDVDGGVVSASGDIDRPVYLRSSAKPMIATAVVASGAVDHYGFAEHEIALAAASHSGEPFHVAGVRSMLAKAGLDESALRCGAHAPTYEPAAQALCERGELPQQIHNNCSGKHAGILALSMHLGADPADYLSPQHPAQQAILDACAALLGMPRGDLIVGTDGCGIPVIAVPLRTAARFFARLSALDRLPAPYRPALRRVIEAMQRYPEYVAGTGRFDTALMTATRPAIVCKGGAEGYHATALLDRGLGLAVKVADGNYRAVSPFVLASLERLHALDEEQRRQLERHRHPQVRNHAGTVVGAIDVVA